MYKRQVLNPAIDEMDDSDLDMVIAGSEKAVLMVESDANELSEDLMIGGILFAHQEMQSVIKGITDFSNEVLPERTKYENENLESEKKVFDEIKNKFGDDIKDAFSTTDKKAFLSVVLNASLISSPNLFLISSKTFFSDSRFSFSYLVLSGSTSLEKSVIPLMTLCIS